MSFLRFLGNLAVSDQGKLIQRVSQKTIVSSDGSVYTRMGSFSFDGGKQLGSITTGIGAVSYDHPHLSGDKSSAPDLKKDHF